MSSISSQINFIVQNSNQVRISEKSYSRHEHQQALRQEGVTAPHEQSHYTAITKSNTFEDYKREWKHFGKWQRNHTDICGDHPQIKMMNPQQVGAYLAELSQRPISYETFNLTCKALSKVDGMIQHATSGKFVPAIASTIKMWREVARETLPNSNHDHQTREFHNPRAVIEDLGSPRSQLAAEIQLATGLRAGDVVRMRLNPDGETFYINSKCGNRFPEYRLPADLTEMVKSLIPQYGKVLPSGQTEISVVPYKSYLADLKHACEKNGEQYSGTHSFRYNFAQQKYLDLRAEGKDDAHARAEVSESLFHHRLDITERYVPKGFGG